MKVIQRFLAFVLVIFLAGCSVGTSEPKATAGPTDTAIPDTTISVEPAPTLTTPPGTTPPETTQPQKIVQPEPENEDFVRAADYIPDIFVDLRYASDNNFTGQRIYDFRELWLRYGTVKKLMQVQEELKQSGFYLKVWDGFRPPSAQFKLWDVCPDPTYVSNPNNGFSSHSRGNTVDITLVYADGTEVVMPTGFDDFSELADRDYSDCGQEAAANALMLEQMMIRYGFKPYSGEWWHFSDAQSYPVEESFEPTEAAWYYADCKEYISLRTQPDISADVITRIPADEKFQVMAFDGDFALVDYQGFQGFVLKQYICLAE